MHAILYLLLKSLIRCHQALQCMRLYTRIISNNFYARFQQENDL
ncbi:hypothetical protein GLYMA_08G097350v4 [Glycine max]|nr:hypothetical protein GLYMA_08G097350v4 [Glycine max]KAH1050433.1 hypothetical protein GYH30_020766 [Glycine max]